MKIIKYFSNLIEKVRNKNQLLLKVPKKRYAELINDKEIDDIIDNMPRDLTELEKAYYVYIELGKIVKANPEYFLNNIDGRRQHYYDRMDKRYYGICKSISELYVSVLRDKRVGVSADLIKQYPHFELSHVDVILKIDDKNYIVNLINDLSKIKTARKVNYFGFDLGREVNDTIIEEQNKNYLEMLEEYYGNIDCLSIKDIERLDKKFEYSFFVAQFSKDDDKGLYTDDTIKIIKEEMNNPELFKEYVLHGKDVPKEEFLKYKLDYIFENVDKFTDFSGDSGYLDNIRYYSRLFKNLLSPEENLRIQAYAATVKDDFSSIISIIKVKPPKGMDNLYYLYNEEERKYIKKTPEEMIEFVNEFETDSLNIIGKFDRFDPGIIEDLEL